jgi:hypothetical protein
MNEPIKTSHSAVVEMWLDCGQHGCVPLARIRPTMVVAKEARQIPPCPADLIVTVDGHRLNRRVMLTAGFSKGRTAARVLPIDDAAPF